MSNTITHEPHCNCTCARTPKERLLTGMRRTLEDFYASLDNKEEQEYILGAIIAINYESDRNLVVNVDTGFRSLGYGVMSDFWIEFGKIV